MDEQTTVESTEEENNVNNMLIALDDSTLFQNEEQVTQIIEVLQSSFPQKEDAYVPSGKTSFFAFLILCFGFLLTVVLGSILDFGLAMIDGWVDELIIGWFGYEGAQQLFSSEIGIIFFLFSIAISALIAAVNCLLPTIMSSQIGTWGKNRNTFLAGIFSFASSAVLSAIFFLPWVDGDTLAPTNFEFFFIPLNWVFIFLGLIVLPIITVVINVEAVKAQRFCEKTEIYLAESIFKVLPIAMTANLIQMFENQNWSEIAQLVVETPPSEEDSQVSMILFSEDNAETAFVNIKFKAVGIYIKDPEKEVNSENIDKKEEQWLLQSIQIDKQTALNIKERLSSS